VNEIRGMRKAFENIEHIILRKRRFKIVLCSRLGSEANPTHGECSDPNASSPMIRYYVGLSGERRLDVLIHEMLHGCFWDMSEEAIQFPATDIARALWRMGYRCESDTQERKPNPPQYITVRSKRYRFSKVAGMSTGNNSLTTAPNLKNKKIHIRKSLKGQQELAATLKGLLVAAYWDISLEVVSQSADDIARALYRIGYRLEGDL